MNNGSARLRTGATDGQAKIVVILIALAVVLGVGYLVGTGRVQVPNISEKKEGAEEVKVENATNGSEKAVVNNETADWSVYRSEKYGFEFRYPAVFEGKTVSVAPSSQQEDLTATKWFTLMESRVFSEKGDGGYYTVPKVQLAVQRLSNANLYYGIDLGGQGGYEYDSEENIWRAHDGLAKPPTRTWEEMFQLFRDDGEHEVKMASGQSAFSYRSCAYESCSSGYEVYDFQKDLVFNFVFSYAPEDGLAEMSEYDKRLQVFLEKIVQTMR